MTPFDKFCEEHDVKNFLLETNNKDEAFEAKYGFPKKETWAVDWSFTIWLYNHIFGYMEAAKGGCIDLHYHKFTILGEEYDQLECCQMIIKLLEDYVLKTEGNEYRTWEEEQEGFDSLRKAIQIWAELIFAMWW